MAFYLLDWDNNGRQETLTAETTAGGVLDGARAFDSIGGGVWATYTVCGSVDFVVTHTAGLNAVVSGVFFGAPVGAGATNYVVDGSGGLSQVVAETDGSGNLTAHYVRVGDQLLAVMRPGGTGGMWTTRFVHADGLGSVRTITDETGAVVDTRGYEAFGTKNVEAGSDPLAYGFAGEAFDGVTHLAYHRARWMDARVGRFVGVDPRPGMNRKPQTWHRYAYVTNGPVDNVDPTGLLGEGDVAVDVSSAILPEITIHSDANYIRTVTSGLNGLNNTNCWSYSDDLNPADKECPAPQLGEQLRNALFYIGLTSTGRELLNAVSITTGTTIDVYQKVCTRTQPADWAYVRGVRGWTGEDTILWDPFSAIKLPNGYESPAVLLAHELGHIVSPNLTALGRLGEQGITDKWETDIAVELLVQGWDETPRFNYFAVTGIAPVADSTSTTPTGPDILLP